MDEKIEKEQILRALESLNLDVQAEQFKTEMYYLASLFEQGKTVADALGTVGDLQMRAQLRPVVYYVILRALVIALTQLHVITPDQATDLDLFLHESARVPAHFPDKIL